MQKKFVIAFGQIQELFQQLSDDGKISEEQAQTFDLAQKGIINFYTWVQNQLDGNFKVELPWTEPEFTDTWKLWRDYKNQQFGFKYKPIGEQAALKDLADLSGGNMHTAIALIHQSMKKGWRGFFELKTNNVITKKLVETQAADYKQQLLNRLKGDEK